MSPRALAVLRLSIAPEDAAGVDAGLTIGIRHVGSIAHEPADVGVSARCVCRGETMMRRRVNQMDTTAVEKGVASDEQSSGRSSPNVAKVASLDAAYAAAMGRLATDSPDNKRSRYSTLRR